MPPAKWQTKEGRVAKQRAYYIANRGKLLDASRARYHADPERWCRDNLERYHRDDVGVMLQRAKARARLRDLEFSICRDDIVIPDRCPVLGCRLLRARGGRAQPESPSLDRIDADEGYVPGNVQVLSYKANAMKSNATPAELLRFADWIQKEYA